MVNWESNVFPGVLGRTCDRPCEPACRRGRVEEEPVAICRLKRVASDLKGEVASLMPQGPFTANGKKIALVGAGPASLTLARDLAPLGYEIHLYDQQVKGGGFMLSQIPAFRLPEEVLDEEVNFVLQLGVTTHFETYVESLKDLLAKDYDAVFVGSGAPRGRDLQLPGRQEADESVHIGIEWLDSVSFKHTDKIGKKVIILGGGNTAMDCCRTARRLGGEEVKVLVRSPFADMKASPWEKEDTLSEDIPILDNHVPKEYIVEDGKLKGMKFEKVKAVYDENGKRTLVSTGEDQVFVEADDVICAVGQENTFPWIERDIDIKFNEWGLPIVDEVTFQSTNPRVYFGGDAAFGPSNIITAVAHGHQAAVSIDLFCREEDLKQRPPPLTNLISAKMGVHEWNYSSEVNADTRYVVPHAPKAQALKDIKMEVELGFDEQLGFAEAQRCLNCDVQTVFIEDRCIECDACMDICPTDCINFLDVTENEKEKELRGRLRVAANNSQQDVLLSDKLKTTGRLMVKDENVCLHCGLCAERCPTTAWDMQEYMYSTAKASEVLKAG